MTPDKYLPIAECVNGRIYRLQSRNLIVGVYREETKGFIGIRRKFGHTYLFEEYHWDTGAPYGTAYPIEEVAVLPDHIVSSEMIGEEHNDPLLTFLRPLEDPCRAKNEEEFQKWWAETKARRAKP